MKSFIAGAVGVSPPISRKGGTEGEILGMWKIILLELYNLWL